MRYGMHCLAASGTACWRAAPDPSRPTAFPTNPAAAAHDEDAGASCQIPLPGTGKGPSEGLLQGSGHLGPPEQGEGPPTLPMLSTLIMLSLLGCRMAMAKRGHSTAPLLPSRAI